MKYIVFILGLVIFIISLCGWVVNLVRSIKNKQDYHKSFYYNQRMLMYNIGVCGGALIVNIGNIIIKSIS